MSKGRNWFVTLGIIGLAVILVASTTGCKRKKGNIDTNMTTTGANTGSATGSGQPDLGADQLAATEWITLPGAQTIYFDYDSSALRADAREGLKVNASAINATPAEKLVRLAGHCDERGTEEYNLALGERRAQAARDYLIQLGVPGSRLITVSYGEEMPAALGHNEEAWAQNRRVETQLAR